MALEIFCTTIKYYRILDKLQSFIKPLGLGKEIYPENWFDVVIVVTSLLHLFFHLLKEGGSSVPDLKTLRMVRLARVVRIISSFSALRKLIDTQYADLEALPNKTFSHTPWAIPPSWW